MNELDFTDKTVVITGGTRGIGYATAEAFLLHGASVVIFGSRAETVDTALKKLQTTLSAAKTTKSSDPEKSQEKTQGKTTPTPQQILGFHPTLTSEKSLQAVFDEIKTKCGHIDVVINNAGTASKTKLTDYTPKEYDQIADLNIKSVFTVSKIAAPYLKETRGCILNTSSMVSLYGQPSGAMYPASKFAVNGLTKSLARELASDGIRVNAVAPGIIETDMMRGVPEEMIAPLVASIPLGRIGQPEDVASAFLFLASPLASYISGVVLSVDGLARS